MFSSFLKRFLVSAVTLIFVVLITFTLLHTIPGGPFDQERQLSPEIEKNLYSRYGLEKRGDTNFWIWMSKDLKSYFSYLSKGQLGPSLKYRDRDVQEIIKEALSPSIELGIYSFLLAMLVGIPLGILSVLTKNRILKALIFFLNTLSISVPSFVLAVALIFLFSFYFSWFSPALWDGPRTKILPVLTLALWPMAYFSQLTRSGILDQLRLDYIRTARAKGLTWMEVVFRHVLKNMATPLLTICGPMVAYLITGSFIVETIFAIPGLGKHFVTAVIDRDYFLVMGVTFLYASILIVTNWFVDMGYIFLDPKKAKEDF